VTRSRRLTYNGNANCVDCKISTPTPTAKAMNINTDISTTVSITASRAIAALALAIRRIACVARQLDTAVERETGCDFQGAAEMATLSVYATSAVSASGYSFSQPCGDLFATIS
jgi:hypothetical protein